MHADSSRNTKILSTGTSPERSPISNQMTSNKHQLDPHDGLPNPADVSYVNRNEESGFMKDMSFNQSFAGMQMDLDDLENNPRQCSSITKTGISPSQSPSISPDLSSPAQLFMLDGIKDFQLVPMISLTSENEIPNQIKTRNKSHSNHNDKHLVSKTGLKGLKLRSRILSSLEFTDREQDETKQREDDRVTISKKLRISHDNEEVKEEQEEEEEKAEAQRRVKDAWMRNSSSSSMSERDRICKICLECYEDENTGFFVAPCKCTGSVKNIHDLCLKTWIESKRIDPKKACCELCHTKYKMKFRYRRKFTPKNAIQEGIVSLISGLCLLGMVIGLFVLVISLLMASDLTKESNVSDTEKKSGASVKVFISLICGVFIAVLSFLLCYSWREAFFVPEVISWEVLDYSKSAQKRRIKRIAAYRDNQEKMRPPTMEKKPAEVVQDDVENGEAANQVEEEGEEDNTHHEGHEHPIMNQMHLNLSKFKSNASELLHLSPSAQRAATNEEFAGRAPLKNLTAPTILEDQQKEVFRRPPRRSQTELPSEFFTDASPTNEYDAERAYTENPGEMNNSRPELGGSSIFYGKALSI